MDTILHAVDIAAPAEAVFDAVATADGLSRWWSTRVESDEKLGGTVRFQFVPDFNPEMEITELDRPNAVAWKCTGGAASWLGASLRFEIEARGELSRLMFTQRYAGEMSDYDFGTFNYNWGYYLHGLQLYVETGTGAPFPGA